MKKTIVIGATNNPERYAYRAVYLLQKYRHELVLIGSKNGEVAGISIQKMGIIFENIDTITLYIGPKHQKEYYDYILQTKPKRLIFNPGTENIELALLAKSNGIHTENACTLVLLSTGQY